jgi:hypothetical protein
MSDGLEAWRIDAGHWPVQGGGGAQLRFLLRYAILAPSGHNTQPWLFRLAGDRLLLFADRTRALPVVDPHDRALVMSCGAALGMLRAAARGFGAEAHIHLLPDPADPDLLAEIRIAPGAPPTGHEVARLEAIVRRRTTRLRYPEAPLPQGLAARLEGQAAADGVELRILTGREERAAVGALVAEGDRAQFADPRFRRELAAWVHSRRSASRDGMSGSAFGMPDLLSAAGALVIRTFDMGDGLAAKDAEIATHSPALMIFATAEESAAAWLAAGMAHAAVLLDVTAAGWTAAYLNQPVEVDSLRPRLREVAGLQGFPQLLLRIGQAPAITPAVRRPVEAVLID